MELKTIKHEVARGCWEEPVVRTAFIERGAATVDADSPIEFVASTEATDRYGDIVRVAGWNLANYKKNPIALFGHDHSMPIGTHKVWTAGLALMSALKLAAAGTSAAVDMARALVQQRVLRAVSVSFLPLEWEYIRDEKSKEITGYDFKKQELLEISLVSVPANQEALAVARAIKGFTPEMERTFFRPAFVGMTARQARLAVQRIEAA
jgi:HK97 family phage prohead protease